VDYLTVTFKSERLRIDKFQALSSSSPPPCRSLRVAMSPPHLHHAAPPLYPSSVASLDLCTLLCRWRWKHSRFFSKHSSKGFSRLQSTKKRSNLLFTLDQERLSKAGPNSNPKKVKEPYFPYPMIHEMSTASCYSRWCRRFNR